MTCPACGAEQKTGNLTCSRCNADLSLLVHLENQVLAHYQEGLRLARSGETGAAALTQFRLALALDPAHVDSYVALGKLYAQSGAYEDAIAAWQRALDLAPEESAAWAKARQGIDKAANLLQHRRETEEKVLIDRQAAARAARRQHRFKLAGLAAATFALGIALAILLQHLPQKPPSPEALLLKWRQSVDQYPHLQQAPLQARVSQGGLVVAGELQSFRDRDQLEAASLRMLPIKVDISGVRVRPLEEAANLERTLKAFLHIFSSPVLNNQPYLKETLAGTQVTVTIADDGRLRVAGTTNLPEARKIIEDLCFRIAGRDRVDTSSLELAPDFLVYRVKPGDYPKLIALRFCGDPRLWEEIRRFSPGNAEVLKDPNRLRVGSLVQIPRHLLKRRDIRGPLGHTQTEEAVK